MSAVKDVLQLTSCSNLCQPSIHSTHHVLETFRPFLVKVTGAQSDLGLLQLQGDRKLCRSSSVFSSNLLYVGLPVGKPSRGTSHSRSSATDPTQLTLWGIDEAREMTLASWLPTWGLGIENVRMITVVDVRGSTPLSAIVTL